MVVVVVVVMVVMVVVVVMVMVVVEVRCVHVRCGREAHHSVPSTPHTPVRSVPVMVGTVS